MQARIPLRVGLVLGVGLLYVLASHWLMTQTEASAWNVVGVLSPMLVILILGTWRSGHRAVALCAALVLATLCGLALLGIQVPSHVLYLLQHAGINFFLALFFGSTLWPGRTSIITSVAQRVHGKDLPPAHFAYTRQVTAAWTVFFLVIVAISLVLFFGFSFETWAVFANLVTPIATATMFIGEFSLRYRLHPEFARSTVADAINAYMNNSKPAAPRVPQ